jgi:hypothetical protein
MLTDDQEEFWHCDEHNMDATCEKLNGWGKNNERWFCPKCNEIIEDAWDEFSGGEESDGNFELSDWYDFTLKKEEELENKNG